MREEHVPFHGSVRWEDEDGAEEPRHAEGPTVNSPRGIEETTEATANEAELIVRLEMDRIALRRLFEQANDAFGSRREWARRG